jgi:hypothetical protein
METQTPPPSSPAVVPDVDGTKEGPAPPKSKNWLFIMLVIFVILLSLGTAAFFAYQNVQLKKQAAQTTPLASPKPTAEAGTTDPTANWKIYKDDSYKYELKYPETNSDYAKGIMPSQQYLDNNLDVGYRLLILRNTLKQQYFRIKTKKIYTTTSLLDYWKSDSDVASSGLIFNVCNLEKCVGSYKNSSKSYQFNLKNSKVGGVNALTIGVTIPSEFQETIIFKLNDDYIMEIDKGVDTLSNQILSTLKFIDTQTTLGIGTGCQYKGKTYADGEGFKDSCNSCSCDNGQVLCTLMACQ